MYCIASATLPTVSSAYPHFRPSTLVQVRNVLVVIHISLSEIDMKGSMEDEK